MRIKIKLFAGLREGRFKVDDQEFADGCSVYDITASLGIFPNEIAYVQINNRPATINEILKDGDIVGLFPPIGGG